MLGDLKRAGSVRAARMEQVHDHQLGVGEEERPRASDQGSEVLVARQSPQVLEADAGQRGDFLLGENLLARLDPDHRDLQTL